MPSKPKQKKLGGKPREVRTFVVVFTDMKGNVVAGRELFLSCKKDETIAALITETGRYS